MNQNLSINNIRVIIQQTTGWIPDIWHDRKLQLGETILNTVPIKNGDVLIIGVASKEKMIKHHKGD